MWPLIEHKMCRRASLDAKHVKPGRWAPAAGDPPGSSSSATTFKLGFDRNNMKPSSFVSGSCWCNRVGSNFLAHGFLSSQRCHITAGCATNLTLSQTAFLKMKISSLHLNDLQGHQISIQQSTFGTWWSGRWCQACVTLTGQCGPKCLRKVSIIIEIVGFCSFVFCFAKIGLSVSPKRDFIFWLNSS